MGLTMQLDADVLHSRLLSIMKDFHKFCNEHKLQYYMLGGTCLGARRHQGFIPWDDDMDIGIPRKDYDRFCNELAEQLPEYLELRYYRNTPDSPMHYVKLIDRRTTLIENNYRNYVEGLYIDIFPLDAAGHGFAETLRWKKIWFLHNVVMYHCMTEKKQGVIKSFAQKWARHTNLQKYHEKLERALTSKKFSDPPLTVNFLGAWGIKEVMDRSLFGTPQLYPFEDAEFYGPEKIDEYLMHLYGNYMQLPPEDQRVFRHNFFFLDLNQPYQEYILEHQNKEIKK